MAGLSWPAFTTKKYEPSRLTARKYLDAAMGHAAEPQVSTGQSGLVAAGLVGAAVAVAVGVYGRLHDPAGQQTITGFFGSTLAFKAWMATIVLLFALVQVITALRMWGKISWPSRIPPWFGQVHRLSGTLAFLASLPIAYHCLWSIGFEPDVTQPRRFVHSIVGCFFYGAFVVKVFAVRSHRQRNWLLPAIGGTVFTSLVVLWLTSSLWFFTTVGFPGM